MYYMRIIHSIWYETTALVYSQENICEQFLFLSYTYLLFEMSSPYLKCWAEGLLCENICCVEPKLVFLVSKTKDTGGNSCREFIKNSPSIKAQYLFTFSPDKWQCSAELFTETFITHWSQFCVFVESMKWDDSTECGMTALSLFHFCFAMRQKRVVGCIMCVIRTVCRNSTK